MKTQAKLTGKELDNFLLRLSRLAESLPSQKEVFKVSQELSAYIKLLKDLQKQFQEVPSGEETDKIISTIEQLRGLIRVTEADPDLSGALYQSPNKGKARLSRPKPSPEYDRKKAKMIASQLKPLSPEEVYKKFEDKKAFPVATLRQVAGELGVRVPSKSTRAYLVERISKKVSNLRGYNYLRYSESKRI
ncbi:MAG: hypothetical protein OXU61_11325 [Gammaproteobacteria bacterium]|nr:hypothetical protein [Gammaproteobacteria bacterium]